MVRFGVRYSGPDSLQRETLLSFFTIPRTPESGGFDAGNNFSGLENGYLRIGLSTAGKR